MAGFLTSTPGFSFTEILSNVSDGVKVLISGLSQIRIQSTGIFLRFAFVIISSFVRLSSGIILVLVLDSAAFLVFFSFLMRYWTCGFEPRSCTRVLFYIGITIKSYLKAFVHDITEFRYKKGPPDGN